jgi:hypothetical protein
VVCTLSDAFSTVSDATSSSNFELAVSDRAM